MLKVELQALKDELIQALADIVEEVRDPRPDLEALRELVIEALAHAGGRKLR